MSDEQSRFTEGGRSIIWQAVMDSLNDHRRDGIRTSGLFIKFESWQPAGHWEPGMPDTPGIPEDDIQALIANIAADVCKRVETALDGVDPARETRGDAAPPKPQSASERARARWESAVCTCRHLDGEGKKCPACLRAAETGAALVESALSSRHKVAEPSAGDIIEGRVKHVDVKDGELPDSGDTYVRVAVCRLCGEEHGLADGDVAEGHLCRRCYAQMGPESEEDRSTGPDQTDRETIDELREALEAGMAVARLDLAEVSVSATEEEKAEGVCSVDVEIPLEAGAYAQHTGPMEVEGEGVKTAPVRYVKIKAPWKPDQEADD
jgi:hypothetical protein